MNFLKLLKLDKLSETYLHIYVKLKLSEISQYNSNIWSTCKQTMKIAIYSKQYREKRNARQS